MTIESFTKKKKESTSSAAYYKRNTDVICRVTTALKLLLFSISRSSALARPLTSICTWWWVILRCW